MEENPSFSLIYELPYTLFVNPTLYYYNVKKLIGPLLAKNIL